MSCMGRNYVCDLRDIDLKVFVDGLNNYKFKVGVDYFVSLCMINSDDGTDMVLNIPFKIDEDEDVRLKLTELFFEISLFFSEKETGPKYVNIGGIEYENTLLLSINQEGRDGLILQELSDF